MRWKTPVNDEVRIRQGFLLFPKKIGNEWRWLEHAVWEEMYKFVQEWRTDGETNRKYLAQYFSWKGTQWLSLPKTKKKILHPK